MGKRTRKEVTKLIQTGNVQSRMNEITSAPCKIIIYKNIQCIRNYTLKIKE